MAALARLPNVVDWKDATNDLARPLLTAFACGEDFCQLSGEDITALAFLANGGAGCISVTANVAPRQCAQMQDAWQRGDVPRGACAIHGADAAAPRAVPRDQPGAGQVRRLAARPAAPRSGLPLVPPKRRRRARRSRPRWSRPG